MKHPGSTHEVLVLKITKMTPFFFTFGSKECGLNTEVAVERGSIVLRAVVFLMYQLR